MSHRGRQVQTSASRKADYAVPCCWTWSSETREGWITKTSLFSAPTFATLKWKCFLGTALQAQGKHHCWLQHQRRTFSTSELPFSPQRREKKRCFNVSSYGRKNYPTQNTLPSEPIAKKIQTSKTEHKIAISVRDIKQYRLCHVSVTHSYSVTGATVDAATDGALRSLQKDRIGSFATPQEGSGEFKIINDYSRSSPPFSFVNISISLSSGDRHLARNSCAQSSCCAWQLCAEVWCHSATSSHWTNSGIMWRANSQVGSFPSSPSKIEFSSDTTEFTVIQI